MLCPEVWNFPPPKTVTVTKDNVDLEFVKKNINMNNFYNSLIITCPDELNIPFLIEEIATEDNDYYKLTACPLSVFLKTTFVDNFVKTGKLYCISAERDCIVQNCVAITPDGALVIHILEYNYQTLGLEGTKQENGFYQIKIDLTKSKLLEKYEKPLQKLESFDFYITWEPDNFDICPSSIAKYFYDQNISIKVERSLVDKISPSVNEIPSLKNVDLEELVEWIGMLSLKADLSSSYEYVSTYCPPECDNALKSSRISLLLIKSFITPTVIHKLCAELSENASSRELDNYWTSLSVQSYTDSPWRWSYSSPSVFQSHDSSVSIFFSKSCCKLFSVGQIKIS